MRRVALPGVISSRTSGARDNLPRTQAKWSPHEVPLHFRKKYHRSPPQSRRVVLMTWSHTCPATLRIAPAISGNRLYPRIARYPWTGIDRFCFNPLTLILVLSLRKFDSGMITRREIGDTRRAKIKRKIVVTFADR